MNKRKEKEKLISIDEVISRVKELGVNFGSGDPKNRLRYYVKIGILPNAKRKSFNGAPPNGAYPESVVNRLVEIDGEIKSGKSIQAIKKEQEKKTREKIQKEVEEKRESLSESPFRTIPDVYEYKPTEISYQPELESKPLLKSFNFLKISLLILTIISISLFSAGQLKNKDVFSYFRAAIVNFENQLRGQLVLESTELAQGEEEERTLSVTKIEPYLTINAETAINAPLRVEESVSAPSFILTKGDYEGVFTTSALTSDRIYTFPNQSGIICLSSGNCVGIFGEVTTPGGTGNRLTKFISSGEIGNSSIDDFYTEGISVTIDENGKLGIGTTNPTAELDVVGDVYVDGEIKVTGDVCTEIGGKCLSQLTTGGSTPIFFGGGGGGIAGSGETNYIPIWSNSAALRNSVIYQSGTNIGIGTLSPSTKLDVAGTIEMNGFSLPTNASSGYVLTSDGSGVGTWQASTGGLPAGSLGQTLYYNGVTWAANSFLYNNGSAIGIGTTSTLATLTVNGDGYLAGPLTISTTTLPQLILRAGDNYLNFSLTATQTELSASSTLIIDSLTGEIRTGGNVTLFNATGSEVRAGTFVSTDATARKSGELILRNSILISRFAVPAQTTSTDYVRISRYISDPLSFLPSSATGTTRKFAFLINFADDIATSASSTWRVYRPAAVATTTTFYFAGQDLPILEEGNSYLSDFFNLPNDDWQLEVKVPASNKAIRIFNIFLIVCDEVT